MKVSEFIKLVKTDDEVAEILLDLLRDRLSRENTKSFTEKFKFKFDSEPEREDEFLFFYFEILGQLFEVTTDYNSWSDNDLEIYQVRQLSAVKPVKVERNEFVGLNPNELDQELDG